LVKDHYIGCALPVARRKRSPAQYGNAHGFKIGRTYAVAEILSPDGARVGLNLGADAHEVVKRHCLRKRRGPDAGNRGGGLQGSGCKQENLVLRIPVAEHAYLGPCGVLEIEARSERMGARQTSRE